MNPQELTKEINAKICPVHGFRPYIRIKDGRIKELLCCCEPFKMTITEYAEQKLQEFASSPEQQALAKRMLVERIEAALAIINSLKTQNEKARQELRENYKIPQNPYGRDLSNAERAIIQLSEAGDVSSDLLEEAMVVYEEARTLADEIKNRQTRWQRAIRKSEKEKAKEHRRMMKEDLPKWISELGGAVSFINLYSDRLKLRSLSYGNLQTIRDLCIRKREAITPLASAFYNGKLTGEVVLKKRLDAVQDKLNEILNTTLKLLEQSKTKSAHNADKQRKNKQEDSPFFRKMKRLYEEKLKKTDLWYENESRRFEVDIDSDYMSYLEAYGRIIRGSLVKADIIIEGEEDVDTWGYFKMNDKVLPFCLREVNVAGNNAIYNLYTFNAVTSTEDFDYDEAITDRIMYLNAKGIKK